VAPPTGRVHPLALEQISRLPVDPGQFTSKSLAAVLEASADPFDLVITVCDHAARHCDPLPADTTRLHWGLPDPAAHTEMEECLASSPLAVWRQSSWPLSRQLPLVVVGRPHEPADTTVRRQRVRPERHLR